MGFHFMQAVIIMIIMPVICITIELARNKNTQKWTVITKWFLFWAVGIRSLSAGLMQIFNPRYTAEIIFNLKSSDFYIFIRELGAANAAIGLSAIISCKYINWRVPVSFISGLFFGILTIIHIINIINFQADFNEFVSLTCDLLIIIVLSTFVFKTDFKTLPKASN